MFSKLACKALFFLTHQFSPSSFACLSLTHSWVYDVRLKSILNCGSNLCVSWLRAHVLITIRGCDSISFSYFKPFYLDYPGGTVAYKLRRPYPLPYLFSSIPCIWIPCYHPHQINSPSLCNTFSISKSLQCMFSYFTGPMTSCASTWSSWRFLFGTGRHHRQMHGRPAACRYIRDNATLGTYKLARIYMDKDTNTNLSR